MGVGGWEGEENTQNLGLYVVTDAEGGPQERNARLATQYHVSRLPHSLSEGGRFSLWPSSSSKLCSPSLLRASSALVPVLDRARHKQSRAISSSSPLRTASDRQHRVEALRASS